MRNCFWLVVCLIFGVETASAQISIETRDEQLSNASQTQLRLRIYNGTGDTLENVELRYFLSEKTSATILEKHYLPGAEAEIVAQDSSISFLKISIPALPPGTFPDSGGFSLGLHLSDWSVIWRAQNLNEDLEHVARGFKLVQHGGETMTVEGMWVGTIVAPLADLILGQSSKTLYGRFLGKNVTVHQYVTIHHVAFEPETVTGIARRER